MRSPYLLAPLVVLAACGDDGSATPDAATIVCTPPATDLPPDGPFATLAELPLPDDCVPGGLRDLPGRWFVADRTQLFDFAYPRFEGDCATGFRQLGARPEDRDASDGATFYTWSDGTRYYARRHLVFGASFEFATARAVCVRPDGTLAMTTGRYDSDAGTSLAHLAGGRFAPKAEPAATGLVRVGSIGQWGAVGQPIIAYNVWVDAGIAYVVGPNGLDLIDVTDPAAPQHLSNVVGDMDDGFNDVRVVHVGGRVVAYAAALYGSVTTVVDVTTPTAPVRLANLPEYSHSIQVRTVGARTLVYLATYTNAVPVYDVTDPLAPVRLGAPVVPGPEAGIHDLFVDGDLIYANNTTVGMVAIDVSAGLQQPAVERGRIATTYSHASWAATLGGRKIVIHGDEGMTPEGGAFMRILDGDPASPTFMTEVGRWQTRPEVGIHNLEIVGTRAYVAYYQDGVRIVELADPAHPVEVAHYNTWDDATAPGGPFEGALGFRPGAGGLAYVADSEAGLIILREQP
ncbi:MAG: hypothetical protein R3B06_03350 [Kofleriaceae bacterium]